MTTLNELVRPPESLKRPDRSRSLKSKGKWVVPTGSPQVSKEVARELVR